MRRPTPGIPRLAHKTRTTAAATQVSVGSPFNSVLLLPYDQTSMCSSIRLRESLSALSLICTFCLCAVTARGEQPMTTDDAPPEARSAPDTSSPEAPPEAAPGSTSAPVDSATSVDACLAAHASSQQLRQKSSLLESRQQLQQCSMPACPEIVRADCLRWMDDLQHQIPSVAFRVTVDGAARADITVYLDDQQLFTQLPTKALEINPGEHRFRFVWGELPPIERVVSISEGEKYAPLVVAFETPSQAEPPPSPAPITGEPLFQTVESRPVTWPTYVLAGVGALGTIGFVGFGLSTASLESELRDSCSPTCTEAQVGRVERRALMADVSLGVGLAALAVAGTLYFTRPTESVQIQARILPRGGGAQGQIHWSWD